MKVGLFIVFLAIELKLSCQTTFIPYLGTGYDVKVGNPEGYSIYSDERDPGLKPIRKIIQHQNKEEYCKEKGTCDFMSAKRTRTYFADDMIKYYRQIQDRWVHFDEANEMDSISCAKSSIKPINVGVGCKAIREVEQILTGREGVMITREISTIYTEARIDSPEDHYTLNPELVKQICKLPLNLTRETEKEYISFVQTWGTHVIEELTLGEKEIHREFYTKLDYFNVLLQIYGNVSSNIISTDYDSNLIHTIIKELKTVNPYETMRLSFGSITRQVPITINIKPLTDFLYKSNVVCLGESSDQGAPEISNFIIENVNKATKQYLLNENDEPSVMERIVTPETRNSWPQGSFSLLKTRDDCPSGWKYGRRQHDTDDSTDYTTYHKKLTTIFDHLPKQQGQHVTFDFCTHAHLTLSSIEWGRGSYCLFKYNDCPKGFQEGGIYIDDEDDSNKNHVNGTLPDGTYNADTRYGVCCRQDPTESVLHLPNKSRFVLMPASSTCQKVFGMRSELLYFEIDCQGESQTSYCSGPYCLNGEHNTLKMFFCLYTPT